MKGRIEDGPQLHGHDPDSDYLSLRSWENAYTSHPANPTIVTIPTRDRDLDHEDEICLCREDDWWVAEDVETGVASRGPSREETPEVENATAVFS